MGRKIEVGHNICEEGLTEAVDKKNSEIKENSWMNVYVEVANINGTTNQKTIDNFRSVRGTFMHQEIWVLYVDIIGLSLAGEEKRIWGNAQNCIRRRSWIGFVDG